MTGFSIKQVVLIQVAVAAMATGVGMGAGWFIGREILLSEQKANYGMSADDLLTQLKKSEQDFAALYAHCEPLEGSERDRLIEAQEKVELLRTDIEAKEVEIAQLEINSKENVQLKAELEKKKRELVGMKGTLKAAEQQREELVEKLKLAVVEVSVARAEARAAKQETVAVRWDEFVAQANLNICEKGTKGKIERCRETVAAAMTVGRERKYRECVRMGNAIPVLREMQKDEAGLPAFAEWVDENNRFTKGWYINFCDPTLPEAPTDDTIRKAVGETDPSDVTGRKDAFLDGMENDAEF